MLKNVYPFSSKSIDSSEPNVLNKTLISALFFFAAAKKQRIDVAGFSSAIFFVRYMAAFWSPSGSVDALKSVVGNTSDELSIF